MFVWLFWKLWLPYRCKMARYVGLLMVVIINLTWFDVKFTLSMSWAMQLTWNQLIVFHVDRPHIENSKVFRAGVVAQPQFFFLFPTASPRNKSARSWVKAATARTFRRLFRGTPRALAMASLGWCWWSKWIGLDLVYSLYIVQEPVKISTRLKWFQVIQRLCS